MGGNTTVFKYDKGGNLLYKKFYSYSAAAGKTIFELLKWVFVVLVANLIAWEVYEICIAIYNNHA